MTDALEPGDEIEVTPEMTRAGVAVLEDSFESFSTDYLVDEIYRAMVRARP